MVFFCHVNFFVVKFLFSFIASGFQVIIKSLSLHQSYRGIHLCVLIASIWFHFTLFSLIHLEFILIYGVRYKSNCIFFQMVIQFVSAP